MGIRQRLRTLLTWFLGAVVLVIFVSVVGEWFIHVADDKGWYLNAGAKWDRAVTGIEALFSWVVVNLTSAPALIGLGLLGGLVIGLWTDKYLRARESVARPPAQRPAAPKERTRNPHALPDLRDLFDTDFDKGRGGVVADAKGVFELTWDDGSGILKLDYRLHMVFHAHAKFLSVYIPASDRTIAACEVLLANHASLLDLGDKSMGVGGGGDEEMKDTELVFTGRIFIYHETKMLLADRGRVAGLYQENGLSPQFRSTDYALHVQLSLDQSKARAGENVPQSPQGTEPETLQ